MRLFLVSTAIGSYSDTHTHARSLTNTQQHPSWLSQREKLEAQLYRGCLALDRCGSTSKTSGSGEKMKRKEKKEFWGVVWAWLVLAGRKQSRDYLPDFATLTPRARATDLGRGPNFEPCVQAGPLRARWPRAREKTRGRERKAWRCAKKFIL